MVLRYICFTVTTGTVTVYCSYYLLCIPKIQYRPVGGAQVIQYRPLGGCSGFPDAVNLRESKNVHRHLPPTLTLPCTLWRPSYMTNATHHTVATSLFIAL